MNIFKRARNALQKFWEWIRQTYFRLYSSVRKWLDKIGLLPIKDDNDFPEVEPQTELPADYQEAFSLKSPADADQLKGRDKELDIIRKAKAAGLALLVSAPMGAGATSILSVVAAEFEGAKLLKDNTRISTRSRLVQVLAEALGLKDVTTLDALVKQEPTDKPVIIFENIERLFQRNIGGFELLNDFLYIINQTSANIVWIVSINSYSHYYLDSVMDLSSNFYHTLYVAPMPREILTELLLSRNQDYNPIFLKPEDLPHSLQRKMKESPPAKRKEIVRDYFFTEMESFAKGNISRAILFWLESVVRVDEKRVYLKPFRHKEKIDPSLEELFVLEAILQHTSLSATDLAKVLDLPARKSEVLINKLQDRNLIMERPRSNRIKEYQINLLFLKELKDDLGLKLNRKDSDHGKR